MSFCISNRELLQLNPEDQGFEPKEVSSYDKEYSHAKSFLQKGSTLTGDNLYDHLTDVLNKILAERPENVIDFFEEYSKKVKEKRFKPLNDHLEDIYIPPGRYNLAKQFLPLFHPLKAEEPSTLDPEERQLADMSHSNMLELLYYFEKVGLGLPRSEMFGINLSMRQLIRTEPIKSIRFWGKIFGLERNYIIIETELKDDEYVKRNENYQINNAMVDNKAAVLGVDDIGQKLATIARNQELGEDQGVEKPWPPYPPLPQLQYEPPPEPPAEPSGVGVNKKVYYVCNEVGQEWIQLPDITPKQIRAARKIYKAFTGVVDQIVDTYPEFSGSEGEYLRAQIARISAGTQISPLGFYTFSAGGMGEDEEMEEAIGDATKTEYVENPKYDPPSLKDLTDKSMLFWVHHSQYILDQGRTSWWNPNPLPEGLDEEQELGEAEETEKPPIIAGPEPETGPPLLTPCFEDITLDGVPAWAVRSSSRIAEEYAIAVVRSNFWPGAYCFATQGKLFQNIYLGSGLKAVSGNFSPVALPAVEQDYPLGPEIMEIIDPTGAEEEEWRIAHLPKERAAVPDQLGEEEEAMGEEDEEEDEEDD